ncbi:MAG: NUDIX domain-containing protein [Flavobacteriaceae bacterium]
MEPSEQIIDKLAWTHIVDGKLLSTRSKGQSKYNIPGGKRKTNEADTQTLFREINEKLHIEIQFSSLNFIGIFEAQTDSHEPGILVHMTCYSANYKGKLRPDSEIEEMAWLHYKDRHLVSEVDKLIFDFLKDQGVLL